MRKTLSITIALSMLAGVSRAAPILSEVYYDAAGPDAPEVFTELLGCPGSSLDGWSLVGINGSSGAPYRTIDLTGGVIPDDGLFVVGTSSAVPALAAVRDFVANVDWQNGPDAVVLLDAMGAIMDALQYGDAGPGNAGEGTPAVDAVPGFSLSRHAWGSDTNDNRTDFLAQPPTPGLGVQPPVADANAPSTLGLLLIGGWALLRYRL